MKSKNQELFRPILEQRNVLKIKLEIIPILNVLIHYFKEKNYLLVEFYFNKNFILTKISKLFCLEIDY